MNTVSNEILFILSFLKLVVMLGYGMVMPIMPYYIEKLDASGADPARRANIAVRLLCFS